MFLGRKGISKKISISLRYHIVHIFSVEHWENKNQELQSLKKYQLFEYHVRVACFWCRRKRKTPTPDGEREITFDDFTFAMQNESKDLTEADKQILLSMAKQLNDARKKRKWRI